MSVDHFVNNSLLSGLAPLKSLSYDNSSRPDPRLDSNEFHQNLPLNLVSENTNRESRLSISNSNYRTSHHDFDSESESECGLAYADPTFDENDNNVQVRSPENQRRSILRSDSLSTTYSQRVRFHPVTDSGRSTAISQVLGIPPKSLNDLDSVRQRSDSISSAGTTSIYSRTTSIGPMPGRYAGGAFDPTMETVMEEVVIGKPLSRSLLTSSSEEVKHLREGSWDQGIGFPTMSPGTHPHRSNTVQVPPHSPETKLPKLPARARTTNDYPKSLLEPAVARKERTRKVRACVHCRKEIEDGRWIRVDTGGVLCERCWKNMYLPKVCLA